MGSPLSYQFLLLPPLTLILCGGAIILVQGILSMKRGPRFTPFPGRHPPFRAVRGWTKHRGRDSPFLQRSLLVQQAVVLPVTVAIGLQDADVPLHHVVDGEVLRLVLHGCLAGRTPALQSLEMIQVSANGKSHRRWSISTHESTPPQRQAEPTECVAARMDNLSGNHEVLAAA